MLPTQGDLPPTWLTYCCVDHHLSLGHCLIRIPFVGLVFGFGSRLSSIISFASATHRLMWAPAVENPLSIKRDIYPTSNCVASVAVSFSVSVRVISSNHWEAGSRIWFLLFPFLRWFFSAFGYCLTALCSGLYLKPAFWTGVCIYLKCYTKTPRGSSYNPTYALKRLAG